MEAVTAREVPGQHHSGAQPAAAEPGDRLPRDRGRLVVGLVGLAFFLIGLAWVVASPTPSGTDEPAHYVRALAAGQGQLIGPHTLYPYRDPIHPDVLFIFDQETRLFTLPANLAPASTYACTGGGIDKPATCTLGPRCLRWAAPCVGDPPITGVRQVESYVGDYEPTWYFVPGLAARLASNDVNGLRAARFGGLVMAIGLLVAGAALLWDRRSPAFSLVGLVIAFTPMAIYLDGVLNANGGEIVAGLAFGAAMVRIWRDREHAPRWVWIAAGLTGAFLAVSRVFGPLWVAVGVAMVVGMLGVRPSLRVLRAGGRPALFAVATVAAGVIVDRLWWAHAGTPKFRESIWLFPRFITDVGEGLTTIFGQQVGSFGWGDVSIPSAAIVIWSVMVLTVLALAVLVGSVRQRVVLLSLTAANLVFTVVVGAILRVGWDYGGTGINGRYVLPFSIIILLGAGETLRANRAKLGSLSARRLLIYLASGAAICHFLGFWITGRRFAVGVNGPLFFPGSAVWRPPFGWWPWILIALLGCVTLVVASVVAVRGEPRSWTEAPA
ncbi:MAG TPA: DUF2142 domain-containing protein [Candidatus Dormibacteraeota bacterium]|jgi:hypothetical protein|nr:DUF2142 domain-containing protein [Candidatus Dormibacteraeota bacterium]